MRILYHHRTLADGAEGVHIHEIVEAFTQLGHDVRVEALVKPAARGQGHTGIWATVKRLLPGAGFELAAAAFNLVDFLKCRRSLREFQPAFVYKRHALYDLGVVLAAQRQGVPVVLEVNRPYSLDTYAEFEPLRFPRLARWFERQALQRSDVVAAVSTPLRDFVDALSGTPGRALVVPNGANPERFRFDAAARARIRERYHLTEQDVVVGWAGILREWHRVDLLLSSTAELSSIKTLIIGDGPDRPRLERLTASLGISQRVAFTGRVPHTAMPEYVSATDIAVASDDRTGVASPMKILEYMAMERAVVAPRLRNIEDLIRDGVDGMLFTPGDGRALAAVLSRLSQDPGFRQAIGARARQTVERSRNWRANAQTVLNAVAAARDTQAAQQGAAR
jgi:glycosyltransferase involved in cell wall biosynthesis